jgi:hypothetical protein
MMVVPKVNSNLIVFFCTFVLVKGVWRKLNFDFLANSRIIWKSQRRITDHCMILRNQNLKKKWIDFWNEHHILILRHFFQKFPRGSARFPGIKKLFWKNDLPTQHASKSPESQVSILQYWVVSIKVEIPSQPEFSSHTALSRKTKNAIKLHFKVSAHTAKVIGKIIFVLSTNHQIWLKKTSLLFWHHHCFRL